ncbi:lasso peptide biosynthesis PqqD family chaperone [Paenibacillus chartarius]|uniref:Lasso peptide biosynthesis PqqD family chaperone n=1 Tax=Paenibacillus chartarius TaxID=747481 RepID=A0ABV6DUY9_9BACL
MSNTITITLQDTVRQSGGTVVSDMDGEKVMLSIENGKYYNLGDIGGDIWALMEQSATVRSMLDTLLDKYNVDPAECEAHLLAFLRQLLQEGLIRVGE